MNRNMHMNMNASYWRTLNEGGEGYVKHEPAVRSAQDLEVEFFEAEDELKSARVNAAYKNGEDGTDGKVEKMEKQVAALKLEQALKGTAPPAAPAIVAPAQVQMIEGKRRTHADAIRFAKAALSGKDKDKFLANVRTAFPEFYPS